MNNDNWKQDGKEVSDAKSRYLEKKFERELIKEHKRELAAKVAGRLANELFGKVGS